MGDIYVGVNNTPKKVKGVWIGVDGVPKRIVNAWVGVNGSPKIIYTTQVGKPIITSVANDGTVRWNAVTGATYYRVKKFTRTSMYYSVQTTNLYLKLQSMNTDVIGVEVVAYYSSNIHSTSDHRDIEWVAVEFNGNGGTPSKDSTNIIKGNEIGTLPTATRLDYDFTGWYFGTSAYSSRVYSTTVFNEDKTIYAHWEAAVLYWTVTFNANGGTCSESSRDVVRGSAIGSLPVPTRSGYDFIYWTVSGNSIDRYFVPTSNCIALANWELILQASYVESVDHTGYVTFASATGASQYSVRKLENGTWYESSKTSNLYAQFRNFSKAVTKLTVKTYDSYGNSVTSRDYDLSWVTTTFDGNGGTPSTDHYDRVMSNDAYYPIVEELGTLPTATRSGYTFDGWWTGTSSYSSRVYPSTKYSSNMIVYAHWKKQTLDKPEIISAVKSTKKVTWTRPSWATKVVLYKSGNSTGTSQDRTIIYASNGHKLSSTESIDTYTGVFLTGTSHTYSNTNYMYEVCVVAWDENGNHVASDWYTAT